MTAEHIICITGMHRSGTSLAASWLELCGLSIHDGSFWGPGPGNPRGHFEDKDFVALHEATIKSENSTSKGWILFSQNPMFFKSDIHLSRALNLIETRNTKYRMWGWKDPRTVLFLEQWKRILPGLKVIMVWRPCNEVVHSLIRRSRQTKIPVMKIGLIKSIRLWKSYNKHLIEFKKKYPQDTLLFSLKDIIRHDRKVLKLINRKFSTGLDYKTIEEIFDRSLLTNDETSFHQRIFNRYFKSPDIEEILSHFSEHVELK